MARSQRKRLRSQSGFSLADIITAIAVAGVVSIVATPVASRMLDYHRLSTGRNQLRFEIARARTQAVGQNAFVRLRFTDRQRYIRERSMDGTAYVQDGETMSLPTGVSMPWGSAPSFNRQGVAATGSTIVLLSGERYELLYTNILGRVRVSQ